MIDSVASTMASSGGKADVSCTRGGYDYELVIKAHNPSTLY